MERRSGHYCRSIPEISENNQPVTPDEPSAAPREYLSPFANSVSMASASSTERPCALRRGPNIAEAALTMDEAPTAQGCAENAPGPPAFPPCRRRGRRLPVIETTRLAEEWHERALRHCFCGLAAHGAIKASSVAVGTPSICSFPLRWCR